MILEYDKSQNATPEQMVRSLMESVQRALDEPSNDTSSDIKSLESRIKALESYLSKEELIWENPNPSDAFDNQTINFDKPLNYDSIKIETWSENQHNNTFNFPLSETSSFTYCPMEYVAFNDSGSPLTISGRFVIFHENESMGSHRAFVLDAHSATITDSTVSLAEDNSALRIRRIYGVKKGV